MQDDFAEIPSRSARPQARSILAALLLLSSDFAIVHAADRAAFIVGVDTYEHLPATSQLRVAVGDAQMLAKTLGSLPEPFAVTLLTDPDREGVSRGLDEFITAAKGAGCALVYFAGHGIEYHGENYLLMSDSKVSTKPDEGVLRVKERLYYETLSLHKLIEDLSATGANLQIVILDACRDNPLDIAGPGGTRSTMGSQSGLGRVNAPSGMLISYSADAGQQANDGLFTGILSEQIKVPGSTLMEVFAKTRSQVRARATALQAEGRGVIHEPAEYSKLEPSALHFSFVSGSGSGSGESVGSSPMPSTLPMAPAITEFQTQKILETKVALAELHGRMDGDRLRYNKALSVINTLTLHKTRAVVEGSPAHHECLAASNIINEIDQRAPEMVAERTRLEAIVRALGGTVE